jgi:hypothetical protein|tara:strand:+ start:747 stop:911 length:165 start_codon:yes stop_codon:yes gene_type:complete
MHQRRKHTLKAELTTDQKFILRDMAQENKRSVKKQTEWILIKAIEEYYELIKEG